MNDVKYGTFVNSCTVYENIDQRRTVMYDAQ